MEIAGALAEMNKFVLPKDYPELGKRKATIHLIEGFPRLLNTMSEKSSRKSREFLERLDVKVMTDTLVVDCEEDFIVTNRGDKIITGLILWTAGISGNKVNGFSPESYGKNGRLLTNRFNNVKGHKNIFAIGDISFMTEENYPSGHPQVAQAAIQQAELLFENLMNLHNNKPLKQFRYKDLGTMATVGRNLAVAELPYIHFHGIFAWFVWMFIHLMSIIGVRNKLLIFINWAMKYFTYDQSTRLILRPKGCA